MKTITQFTIAEKGQQLIITVGPTANAPLVEQENWAFNTEFLRVVAIDASAKAPVATHKKLVKLSSIESVGKHGFRLIFDDGFSQIYSVADFKYLNENRDRLWQQYLQQLAASGHSREATIDIKQL
ncbi:gamma-butyrobetaine hydroxylase-like domain-containing protein [Colwellia sp. MEBiC06753]